MKTDPKVAKAHIEARLKEKVSRPSTASVDREAARAVANVESERKAFNANRVSESKSISKRVFSTPKRGR